MDEYSCATTAEINGTHHSNSNSTSSAFEMGTNCTALPDLPLPLPPFLANNVSFRSQSANSSKYFENKNENSIENQKPDMLNDNNYRDSDNDSTAYSQIEPDYNSQNRHHLQDEVKAGVLTDRLRVQLMQQNGVYGSTRMYASRNNAINGSSRYQNAKIKSQNANTSNCDRCTDFFDLPNTSIDSSSSFYSKPKLNANEILRPHSSQANPVQHKKQVIFL